jgi:hypothetical protein
VRVKTNIAFPKKPIVQSNRRPRNGGCSQRRSSRPVSGSNVNLSSASCADGKAGLPRGARRIAAKPRRAAGIVAPLRHCRIVGSDCHLCGHRFTTSLSPSHWAALSIARGRRAAPRNARIGSEGLGSPSIRLVLAHDANAQPARFGRRATGAVMDSDVVLFVVGRIRALFSAALARNNEAKATASRGVSCLAWWSRQYASSNPCHDRP